MLFPERQKLFELLMSLVKTQQQPVIICGPDGIGKTTFIKHVIESHNQGNSWHYVLCDNSLTISLILAQLSSFLSISDNQGQGDQKNSKLAQKLISELDKIAEDNRTVILVLDNAGSLPAGVVTKLFTFARQGRGLQLILSLTPDSLFIKRATDPIIDESYVVDIPPLNKDEVDSFTFDYIRCRKDLLLEEASSIDEDEMTKIYHHSQGIPGLVVKEINNKYTKQPTKSEKIQSGATIRIAVLGLIGVLIWGGLRYIGSEASHSPETEYVALDNAPPPIISIEEHPKSSSVNQDISNADNTQSVSVLPTTEEILNSTLAEHVDSLSDSPAFTQLVLKQKEDKLKSVSTREQKQVSVLAVEPPPQQKHIVEVIKSKKDQISRPSEHRPLRQIHGPDWILMQPKDNYTLQLMASREKARLQREASKLSSMRNQLAYYQMKRNGSDWYALIYGVYPTTDAAKTASKQLPGFLGKPYLQAFSNVQARIRNFQ